MNTAPGRGGDRHREGAPVSLPARRAQQLAEAELAVDAATKTVRVPRWFLPALVSTLGVHNLGWFVYFLLIPPDTLRRSPTWEGALRSVPAGEPALLGGALGLAGALILAAVAFPRLHDVGLLGHVLAVGVWCLLAGSHTYSALHNDGLGAGTAQVFALVALLHALLAYLRRH